MRDEGFSISRVRATPRARAAERLVHLPPGGLAVGAHLGCFGSMTARL